MKSNGGEYLSDLSKRNMRYKPRVIVISETDRKQWMADLKDQKCLDYFWEHTDTVTTYWMFAKDFRDKLPWLRSVPEDFALYDRQLLISYDESAQLLSFDVVGPDADEIRIFQSIDQLARHKIPVLHPLPRMAQPNPLSAHGLDE
jgi:hypothetical protein